VKPLKILAFVSVVVGGFLFCWFYPFKRVLQTERVGVYEVQIYVVGGIGRDNESLYVSVSDDSGVITVARLAMMEDYGRFRRSKLFNEVTQQGASIVLKSVDSRDERKNRIVKIPWVWASENK
jgi:hypothetical protein